MQKFENKDLILQLMSIGSTADFSFKGNIQVLISQNRGIPYQYIWIAPKNLDFVIESLQKIKAELNEKK